MSTGRGARNPQSGLDPTLAMCGAAAVLAISAYGGIEAALHLGSPLSGIDQIIPVGPITLIRGLADGSVVWSTGASVIMVFFGILALAATVLGTAWMLRRRRKITRVDDAGLYLGRPREMKRLTDKSLRADIARLGTALDADEVPGGTLGRMVLGPNRFGVTLYPGPEDVCTHIWGPRVGKTTCVIIPQILAARGAVLTTSNKRDVVDETRTYRAEKGSVWVFDPRGVALEMPSWFYDPLSWVRSARPSATGVLVEEDSPEAAQRRDALTDLLGSDFVSRMNQSAQETKASMLANIFATSSAGEKARRDPFFDPMGERLLTGLLLAAAVAELPLPIVYTWASDVGDRTPIRLLEEHGFEVWAAAMQAQYTAPDKQRGGVFATASNMIGCLAYAEHHPWISRIGDHDTRPEFDPAAFAAETSPTLYSLSMEGVGECGALVTALTVAVTDALVDAATATPISTSPPLPAGRLRVPATYALDEAANVVRWKDLPNLYSHFGSRGILVSTILQSWSQGEECWGQGGMRKLWGASTIRVYGGGGSTQDGRFLDNVSEALGDHWEMTETVSAGRGGASRSTARQQIRTLTKADLVAMPAGRAVLAEVSKCPAALVETLPWYTGPYAEAVAAAKIRAGQDPTVEALADDPELGDPQSLLAAPKTRLPKASSVSLEKNA
ncbi:type IV secretory system conjugative DNA transfer family protein [Rhodococcoides fascians]|uniref:type IV secretory system conjugative DNA transfer family protein n=1 Tax=Rhodococcoides fascians TaxID=1828 RepID=UPI00068C1EA5|nr:TraM recognition domain-containing protein [Rhodococcus fascians]